jgi:hypothetical protein
LVCGLVHFVARSGEEVAQNAAQVFLILDDEDAFGHAAPLCLTARIGSSILKVEPLPSVD